MRALTHVLQKTRRAGHHFGTRVRQHPIISITLSLLLVGGVALCIGLAFQKPIAAAIESATNPEPPKERRAIDGVYVLKGMANPPLVSVMIENARDAQPISGVEKASLVYESLVESTITRLMIVIPFPATMTLDESRIGPVRSVRPYYLNWTTELGAMLAHVGGSPAALDRIKAKGLLTLNEYSNGKYFHRDRTRYAPHNIYTTTTALAQAIEDKLRGTSLEKWSQSLPAWQFKDDAKDTNRGTATRVKIGYTEPYSVTWEYTTESNDYTRMQWGGPHTTAEGVTLKAKNILVVVQDMAILDELGRKQFTTEGSGKSYLFRDGTALVGRWQKDSPSARMRLFDESGNEMQLNAGVSWIEIVPETATISY